MRVQANPEAIGRCGCGRRVYCDGSHGLTEAQWQAQRAREQGMSSPPPPAGTQPGAPPATGADDGR